MSCTSEKERTYRRRALEHAALLLIFRPKVIRTDPELVRLKVQQLTDHGLFGLPLRHPVRESSPHQILRYFIGPRPDGPGDAMPVGVDIHDSILE